MNAVFERATETEVRARLEVLDPAAGPARTTRRILDEWRRVELAIAAASDADAENLRARFAALRDEYQRVFRAVGSSSR